MQLLDDQTASRIESHLVTVIDKHLDAPGLGAMREKIRDYVLAGGKRIRPQLVVWTRQLATGGRDLDAATLDVAAGWELFHAFLLVHDDIIDDSSHRRGRPALHHELASLDSNSIRFGTNLGIVAGDLLFSAAMCLWHGIDIEDAAIHRELLRLISRVACTTGFGQAIDICASHMPLGSVDASTLLREYHWKTAAYTFEGPMLSGAILAGLGREARDAISRFALTLGQAYQVQNDLDDLMTPAHPGCDIMQGKRTFTLLEHRRSLSADAQKEFDAQLDRITSSDGRGVALADCLRASIVGGSAAMRESRALISTLTEDARRAAADPSLPDALRAGMTKVIDRLHVRYFKIS